MGAKTMIAWADHTFNPAWGCVKVSPGCKNCYAEDRSRRFGGDCWGPGKPRRTFGAKHWAEPLKWNRWARRDGVRRRVFSASMCDIWEEHPTIDKARADLWIVIAATPWLDWLLLTKRPERIAGRLPDSWGLGWANVWLGVSIENYDYVWRADELRNVSAVLRFISYEPALGPLDKLNLDGIGWLIYGGESGPHFRGHDIQWPRDMRRRCGERGIPFFYKQSPARWTERGTELDGEIVREYPESPAAAYSAALFD